ncbi:MAG: hypothetical protein R2699_09205 [Acidimicrobiales bacterium]
MRFGADVAGVADRHSVAHDVLGVAGMGLADAGPLPGDAVQGEQLQRGRHRRALATGNDVLLADEPTGELDSARGSPSSSSSRSRRPTMRRRGRHPQPRGSRAADRVVELSGNA